MAMSLRLTDEESAALRSYADAHGQSMQEAAREAVRRLTHEARRDDLIARIVERDRDLLDRLAQ